MTRIKVLMAGVLVGAAAMSMLPGAAHAAERPLETHSCGDTITHSFRLANDLVGCTTRGLIVNGDNITIDLNKKRIEGTGQALSVGVDNATHTNTEVTVFNGVIKRFGTGLLADGKLSRNVLLTISGNGRGAVLYADSSYVSKSVLTGNGIGAEISSAKESSVQQSAIADNNIGVALLDGANANSVSFNMISGNADEGVFVRGDDNIILDNRILGNGSDETEPGVFLETTAEGNSTTINKIHGNAGDGYQDGGTSNEVTANDARANGFATRNGVGTGIDAAAATTPGGERNTSIGNDNGAVPCTPASLCKSLDSTDTSLPLETHSCGQTITHSFRLANNLTGCTGFGLKVGADDVIVDLNGKRVVGTRAEHSVGIAVQDGITGASIRNGAIKQFSFGVRSGDDEDEVRVSNITAAGNFVGAVVGRSTVEGSTFASNGWNGLEVRDRALVSGNTFAGNQLGAHLVKGVRFTGNWVTGTGIGLIVAERGNVVSRNTIDGNVHSQTPEGPLVGIGIILYTQSKRNVVSSNQIRGSGGDAYRDYGTSNTARGNTANGNGYSPTDGDDGGFDASEAKKPAGERNQVIGADQNAGACLPKKLCRR